MLYIQNPLQPQKLIFLLARLSYVDLQHLCPVASSSWLSAGVSSTMFWYFTFVYLCISRQGLNNINFNGFGRRNPKPSGYFITTQDSISFRLTTRAYTHATLAIWVALWWLSIEMLFLDRPLVSCHFSKYLWSAFAHTPTVFWALLIKLFHLLLCGPHL